MTPERWATIEGIKNGAELMCKPREGETQAEAIVRHGQEDNLILEEVQEFLEGKKAKAA